MIYSNGPGQWVDSNTGKPVDQNGNPTGTSYVGASAPAAPGLQANIGNPYAPGGAQVGTNNAGELGAEWEKNYNAAQMDKAKMAGAPTQTPWNSLLDDQGNIKSNYKVNFNDMTDQIKGNYGNVNVSDQGLNAVRDRALGTGDSPWLKLQMQKQQADEANQLGQTQAQGAGDQATAESNLAMRGGLQSGTRERLAKSGAISQDLNAQGVRQGGANNRLGLQVADEATKTNLLSQLPGMENSNASTELAKQNSMTGAEVGQQTAGLGAQQYNIGNALSDILQKRGYDVNNYNQQMSAWGAGKTADAQGGGGKK